MYSSRAARPVVYRMLRRSVPSGPDGPCFSMMPKGKAQVPLDACSAATKSGPVSSSHFADSPWAADEPATTSSISSALTTCVFIG